MKKLVIAYHGYMFGDKYMTMMTDQFRRLMTTDLYKNASKVYIGIVDSPDKKPPWGIEWINKFWGFSSSKEGSHLASKVDIIVYPENNELRDTLRWIRDYAKDNPDDYILFFHSKGVTRYNEATESWRAYMEYFTIEKWQECVRKLDEGYDCCGVIWIRDTVYGDWPHFSGAFYWAKASYINTLDHNSIDTEWRYGQEFWIGTNPNVKAFEFHNSRMSDIAAFNEGRSHYSLPYPRENYEKIKTP